MVTSIEALLIHPGFSYLDLSAWSHWCRKVETEICFFVSIFLLVRSSSKLDECCMQIDNCHVHKCQRMKVLFIVCSKIVVVIETERERVLMSFKQ